jgi:rod shape-determining protein MreC
VPSKRFDQASPFLTLGILVAAWLIVPTAVKSFARASFFALTAPITLTASKVRDLQEFWALRGHSKTELIEAGRDQARVNASFEVAAQRNTDLQADFSAWWQRIVISKGRNFRIPLGAPVIFSGGVVGRVAEVHATTAVVELISSASVRLAGVVEGDNRPISFQGGLNPTFAPPKGVVELMPLDIMATPQTPKRLVTSGFGGVFPPGLTLGTIVRAELGSDGLFKSGEVRLDERLGSLTEVSVMVPLNLDVPAVSAGAK